MKNLLTLILALFFAQAVQAQCNLILSATEVCGGEAFIAKISPTNDNFNYRINAGSLGLFYGDSVIIVPPGKGNQYTVNLISQRKGSVGNWVNCGMQKQVVVKATPNGDIELTSGELSTNGEIVNCGTGTDNFLFEFTNVSTTQATNTQYIINWGDGSEMETFDNSFTGGSHSYPVGLFTLTYTIVGDGDAACTPLVSEYTVFNGSSPTVGIEDPFNIVGSLNLCPPILGLFDISNIDDNTIGTTYEIKIDGEVVLEYDHPPPARFEYEFTETSCGKIASNGVPNTYDITIEAYSPCPGPPDFSSIGPIIIGDTVSPDFTYNPDPVCVNEVITFTNDTEGTLNSVTCALITEVEWDIQPATGWTLVSGDLEGSSQIQVMFDDPAAYEVVITAANSCDTLEKSKMIEVNELPFADAIAMLDDLNSCAPTIATFTNLSTQDSSVTYQWNVSPSGGVNFVNGSTSSDFEPEIEFTKEGNYTVTLTVANSCGSPQWDTTFNLNAKPEFDIPTLGNVCADTFIYDENVTFSGNSDSIIWTFSGGIPATFSGDNPPPVAFIGNGDHTISISAYNICGVTTKSETFTLSEPVDIEAGNDIQVCFNEATLTLIGSPANGVWTGEGVVGTDQFDPSLTTQNNVTLTYVFDNGICFFKDSINAEVIRVNSLDAGADQTICVNAEQLILFGQSPTDGTWIGDAVSDGVNGIFDPQLAVLGLNEVGYIYTEPILGCQDTVYKNVDVLDIPSIVFNLPDTVCQNQSVDFELNVDSTAIVNWNFGNGDALSGASVSYIYSMEGIYMVSAEIIQNGCSVTDSVQIHVISLPSSDFTIDKATGCNAFAVNFSDASTGHVDNVLWDLGNGQSSTDLNPQNILYQPGTFFDTTYYVTLISYNQCGENSTLDSIMVSKAPEARFGTNRNQYCQEDSVLVNNVSFNSPTAFFWDFGNGNTSTVKHPKPLYYETSLNDTSYTITLMASNVCGTDTARKDVLVRSVDVRSFFNIDNISGCEPLDVSLINFSSVGANPFWDLGDGNSSVGDTVLHTYQNAGLYTVELAVDNGCSEDTTSVDIEVFESPEASFTLPERACQLSDVAFINTTVNGVGYEWDFADGNGSGLVNPTHIFENEGFYSVSLTATGGNLCNNTISNQIEILSKPIAAFDTDENRICESNQIQFINQSTGENYEWNFGDGKKSFVKDPINTYFEKGDYDVMLITDNDKFCFDSIIKPGVIEVFGTPEADFEYAQSEEEVLEGTVTFNNLSSNDATEFLWNFGDDEFYYEEENPSYNYTNSGPYSVLLVAENNFGCIDSIIKPIMVEFFGKLFVPNALSPALGDISQASIFMPKGVALIEYELEIYSTYGELLFRTNQLIDGQPAEGWDGTFKGEPMPQDNYVWKIRAIFDNGTTWSGMEGNSEEINTVGTLVLIR